MSFSAVLSLRLMTKWLTEGPSKLREGFSCSTANGDAYTVQRDS